MDSRITGINNLSVRIFRSTLLNEFWFCFMPGSRGNPIATST